MTPLEIMGATHAMRNRVKKWTEDILPFHFSNLAYSYILICRFAVVGIFALASGEKEKRSSIQIVMHYLDNL